VDLAAAYLEETIARFRSVKTQADGALAQLSDEHLHLAPGEGANSIAVIVQHLAGNFRSRFSDFLTADGEKPERDRDAEFIDASLEREVLLATWEEGWRTVMGAISALKPEDLTRTIAIRGEPHTVLQALQRSITHAAGHVGQIVYLAKILLGDDWRTLSIPRGKSREFDAELRRNFARNT
jgi:uncharacterized damage-inducible protein DinB